MGRTIIDSLVTELGLDASGMKKGAAEGDAALRRIEERSNKTSQSVSKGAKDMGEAVRGLKSELLGLLAVFGVALSVKGAMGFFDSLTKGNAAIGRFAANVGLSARRVDAFRIVAREFGASSEDAMSALQNVSSGISEALMTGQSAFVKTARANGITLRNSHGDFLKTDQVLLNIGERLQSIAAHNGPMGRQLAYNLAGRLGVGSIFNELMDPNLAGDLGQAQGLSGMSRQAVVQAEALQKQWVLIGAEFDKVKNQIYVALAPALLRLGKDFDQWVASVNWNKVEKNIEGWIKATKDFVEEYKGDLKPALEVLGGLLALKLISPLTAVIGLLTGSGGLVTAIGLAAAAMAGWKVGAWIESNFSQAHQDDIGRFVAQMLALGGDKTAQEALDTEYRAKQAQITRALPDLGAPSTPTLSSSGMPVVRQGLARRVEAAAKAGKFGRMSFADVQALRAAGGHGDISVGDPFNPRALHESGMLPDQYFNLLEKQYKVPSGTLQSTYMRESAGGTLLQSPKGALGPMGFEPKTAAELGLRGGEIFDLSLAADAAARYLVRLHKMFGSWSKAKAAYNWGPGHLQHQLAYNSKHKLPWYTGLPQETLAYVNNYRHDIGRSPLGSAYGAGVVKTPAQAATLPTQANAVPSGTTRGESTYNIHTVNIHTKATDAEGIKRSLSQTMANNRTVSSTNSVIE